MVPLSAHDDGSGFLGRPVLAERGRAGMVIASVFAAGVALASCDARPAGHRSPENRHSSSLQHAHTASASSGSSSPRSTTAPASPSPQADVSWPRLVTAALAKLAPTPSLPIEAPTVLPPAPTVPNTAVVRATATH